MAEPLGTVKKGMGPPPEVLNYFRDRQLTPRFSWLDVWGEEHANAFTVAKAVDLQLLGTFKASIDKALSNGQTFENWRAEIKKELQAQGWWGPRMVSDPTGRDPDRMVDFSRSRRLEVIFRSNMSAARAAGQWERAQRTKKVLPYLLYLRTTSTDPRPEHLKLAGIILPIDDPFWRTYFPPNGWLCKCHVRQISAAEAKAKLGRTPKDGEITYTDTPPDLGPPRRYRNRRTGVVTEIPAGIDPGWQTNPGIARAATLARRVTEEIQTAAAAATAAGGKEAGEAAARQMVESVVRSDAFRFHHAEAVRRATTGEKYIDWELPVAVMPKRITDVIGEDRGGFVLARDFVVGKGSGPKSRHPTQPLDWLVAQLALDEGEIRRETTKEGVERVSAIAKAPDGRIWMFAMDWTGGGIWKAISFFPFSHQGHKNKPLETRILKALNPLE